MVVAQLSPGGHAVQRVQLALRVGLHAPAIASPIQGRPLVPLDSVLDLMRGATKGFVEHGFVPGWLPCHTCLKYFRRHVISLQRGARFLHEKPCLTMSNCV